MDKIKEKAWLGDVQPSTPSWGLLLIYQFAEDEHFRISFLLPRTTKTFPYFMEINSSILKKEIKSFRRKHALEQTKSSFFTICSTLLFVPGKRENGYLKGCVKSHLYRRIVEIQNL